MAEAVCSDHVRLIPRRPPVPAGAWDGAFNLGFGKEYVANSRNLGRPIAADEAGPVRESLGRRMQGV